MIIGTLNYKARRKAMKKIVKRITLLMLTSILTLNFFSNNVYAEEIEKDITTNRVYCKFGLAPNINALVKIIDEHFNIEYKSWYGLTGGLATSARVPANAYFYGYSGNNSVDSVIAKWASIDY